MQPIYPTSGQTLLLQLTPVEGKEVIAFYKKAADLAGDMYTAVRAGDIARFSLLEAQYAQHVACLKTREMHKLSGELRKQKIALLQKIMAYDREIRNLLDPWMGRLESLINSPA